MLPSGRIEPIGYIVLRHSIRLDRPVKAFERWIARMPSTYAEAVLDQKNPDPKVTIDTDPNCIAKLKDYRSLMPLAQEARKPIRLRLGCDGSGDGGVQQAPGCQEGERAGKDHGGQRVPSCGPQAGRRFRCWAGPDRGDETSASGLDHVTAYYILHRHDFGVSDAPVGPCILYAISCNLSDRDLADRHEILLRTGGLSSASCKP
jgi:hypothetical protein